MDIIKMTRELGAAIQQDERYLRFTAAREANEKDEELMGFISQIQLIQMNFQQEASKGEEADETKIAAFNKEFEEVYTKFMTNEKMKAYEEARAEIDELMNYVMQILGLCVNGEDPYTCEPQKAEEHDCGGSCSSCSGCH